MRPCRCTLFRKDGTVLKEDYHLPQDKKTLLDALNVLFAPGFKCMVYTHRGASENKVKPLIDIPVEDLLDISRDYSAIMDACTSGKTIDVYVLARSLTRRESAPAEAQKTTKAASSSWEAESSAGLTVSSGEASEGMRAKAEEKRTRGRTKNTTMEIPQGDKVLPNSGASVADSYTTESCFILPKGNTGTTIASPSEAADTRKYNTCKYESHVTCISSLGMFTPIVNVLGEYKFTLPQEKGKDAEETPEKKGCVSKCALRRRAVPPSSSATLTVRLASSVVGTNLVPPLAKANMTLCLAIHILSYEPIHCILSHYIIAARDDLLFTLKKRHPFLETEYAKTRLQRHERRTLEAYFDEYLGRAKGENDRKKRISNVKEAKDHVQKLVAHEGNDDDCCGAESGASAAAVDREYPIDLLRAQVARLAAQGGGQSQGQQSLSLTATYKALDVELVNLLAEVNNNPKKNADGINFFAYMTEGDRLAIIQGACDNVATARDAIMFDLFQHHRKNRCIVLKGSKDVSIRSSSSSSSSATADTSAQLELPFDIHRNHREAYVCVRDNIRSIKWLTPVEKEMKSKIANPEKILEVTDAVHKDPNAFVTYWYNSKGAPLRALRSLLQALQ